MAVKKLKVGNIDKGLLIYEETSNSVAEKSTSSTTKMS